MTSPSSLRYVVRWNKNAQKTESLGRNMVYGRRSRQIAPVTSPSCHYRESSTSYSKPLIGQRGLSGLPTGTSNPDQAFGGLQEFKRVLPGPPKWQETQFGSRTFLIPAETSETSVFRGGLTERHYSPWVRDRQEQLEADIVRSWSTDPVVLQSAKGTPGVRTKTEVVN